MQVTELLQTEKWFLAFAEASLDIITVQDPDGTIRYVSPSVTSLLGYEQDELVGMQPYDYFHPDDVPAIGVAHADTLHAADEQKTTYRFRRKDGTYSWLESKLQAVQDPATGDVAAMFLITRDVNDWKATEEALRESEERTRRILETANEAYLEVDSNGLIVEWNRQAEVLLGWTRDEVKGQSFPQLMIPERQRQVLRNDRVPNVEFLGRRSEFPIVHRDGHEFPVEITTWQSGTDEQPSFSAFLVDIRERLRLESELQVAQKLEAVGRVAAGMAHEINSPVQYVGDNLNFLADAFESLLRVEKAFVGFVERANACAGHEQDAAKLAAILAEEDLDFLAKEVPVAIEQTQSGIARVANIVRAMRSFGRVAPTPAAPADINPIICDALTMVDPELKYVADVEVELGEIPPVMCHGAELGQAIINLVVNAGHAVSDSLGPDKARGVVRVETASTNEAVRISITDDGVGIDPAIASRIFDPFYTTKEFGRGTGQGLAQARNVIENQHHGSLTFTSEVGRGTTFVAELPIDWSDESVEESGTTDEVRAL